MGRPRGPDLCLAWAIHHVRCAGVLYAGAVLTLACGNTATEPVAKVEFGESVLAYEESRALSASVSIQVTGADSVAVRFRSQSGEVGVTPAVTPSGGEAEVPVLGLRPEHEYTLEVVAFRGLTQSTGQQFALTTAPLPADLPQYVASGSNPTPGFVAFGAGMYGIVIDNTGRIVWYHRFSSNPGLNLEPQPNGRYVARPVTPAAGARDGFVEIDPLGRVTRTLSCVGGLVSRFHDLIAEPDGSYWILCDETRHMDLTGVGGVAAAQVTGTVVQHVSEAGALLFQWNAFDHFAITDLDSTNRTGTAVNWTHGNALDIGPDGTLIVSFRSLSEVTGINATTGAVLWRLGGRRNQFTFTGPDGLVFARQHGVRITGPGELTLLDNLGNPVLSRVEGYAIDPVARTARLVAAFDPSVPTVAHLGGTTQRLSTGHTLAAYGNGGRVEEYDASGRVVWQIVGNAGYVFRAQRIASLYAPGTRP